MAIVDFCQKCAKQTKKLCKNVQLSMNLCVKKCKNVLIFWVKKCKIE